MLLYHIPSPCSTLMTTDVVSTDWVESVPELAVEMPSEWLVGHSACRGEKKPSSLVCFNLQVMWPTNFDFSGWRQSCMVPCTDTDMKTAHIHILGQSNSNSNLGSWLMIMMYSCCVDCYSIRGHHSNNEIAWYSRFAQLSHLKAANRIQVQEVPLLHELIVVKQCKLT